MVENKRICLDLLLNPRAVSKFEGKRMYISTGDSDDIQNGTLVDYYNKPSRANVDPCVGDVLFAKMSKTRKVILIDQELSNNIFSTGFFDVSSKKIYPKYLYYFLQSKQFESCKDAYSEGTTQISLTDKRLRLIKVSYETNFNKQKQIADFLDNKIIDIEKIIECEKNQIIEFKKMIDSLINETIYKCPDTKNGLQLTGSWISNISKDWRLQKMKYIFNIHKGLDITKANLTTEGIPVISYGQTHNAKFIYSFSKKINELPRVPSSYLKYSDCLLKKGDFIFVDTSEDIKGSTDFSLHSTDELCFAGYHSLIVSPKKTINSRFFMYQFRSSVWSNQIRSSVDGVKVYSITQKIINDTEIVMPPLTIQNEIADKLDSMVETYDRLISIKTEKINELTKYKETLIYEYVSGKKEVA